MTASARHALSVDNVERVKILHGEEYLRKQIGGFALWKRAFVDDAVEELTCLRGVVPMVIRRR